MKTLWLCLLLLAVPLIAFAQGTEVTPIADVSVTGSATLIAGQDAFRFALNCTNNSGSVAVRWGSASVTASTGQRLPPNASIEIQSRGSIYMISEGANVTVSCTKESK